MMVRTSRRPSFSWPAGSSVSAAARGASSAVSCCDAAVTDTPPAPEISPSFALRRLPRQAIQSGAAMRPALLRRLLGQANRPMQRTLLDGEQAEEGDREADRSGNEHPVKGRRHIAMGGREFFQRHRAGAVVNAAKHDGAEHRDNDCAAERTKKVQR